MLLDKQKAGRNMAEEKAPLLASDKFRLVMQEDSGDSGDSRGPCGCSCAKLPAICRNKKPQEKVNKMCLFSKSGKQQGSPFRDLLDCFLQLQHLYLTFTPN